MIIYPLYDANAGVWYTVLREAHNRSLSAVALQDKQAQACLRRRHAIKDTMPLTAILLTAKVVGVEVAAELTPLPEASVALGSLL